MSVSIVFVEGCTSRGTLTRGSSYQLVSPDRGHPKSHYLLLHHGLSGSVTWARLCSSFGGLTHCHCMSRVSDQHCAGMSNVLPRSEDPIVNANGTCLCVFGESLHERAKWFSPVRGQLFHECNPVGAAGRQGNPFGIGPRNNDLTVIAVLATVIEVVRSIQDYNLSEYSKGPS